ncbi:hypothetical protein DFH09DRAFT_1249415 [Mycena vulgaris]|nr:hypothetical protein DFH09DRAFT_1249415 [Mycena vulgaris]
MRYTGRRPFSELPAWRKDFKAEWRKCWETPITLPLNPKYRPDPDRWLCTCPHYFKSRFLICKHLVTRNRTAPFWSHPALRPLNPSMPSLSDTFPHAVTATASVPASREQQHDDQADESDEELAELMRAGQGTFDERLTSHLQKLRDFCDGLEYQREFGDSHMLDTCLSRERRNSSTRSAAPVTWERSTANAMFYRTRPVQSDRGT